MNRAISRAAIYLAVTTIVGFLFLTAPTMAFPFP